MCGHHRINSISQFSSSAVWVLEMELRSSGLVAGAVTH